MVLRERRSAGAGGDVVRNRARRARRHNDQLVGKLKRQVKRELDGKLPLGSEMADQALIGGIAP
jgi:hypothetical protein